MPLGDILEKRRLLFCFMLFAALGLIISGISQHISLLILGTLITGLFSVAAQLLLPLAASLVPAQQSGRVVGFLLSGLMMGVLLARSLSGLASSLFAWNFIYLASGILLFCIAFILHRNIGVFPPTSTESYGYTLRSLASIFDKSTLTPAQLYWRINLCWGKYDIYYYVTTTCTSSLSYERF